MTGFDQGSIRDAAEKAWGATRWAIEALLLVSLAETRAGSPPALPLLPRPGPALHGKCFYNGLCDPLEDTERWIRETGGYVQDAQRLAEGEILGGS